MISTIKIWVFPENIYFRLIKGYLPKKNLYNQEKIKFLKYFIPSVPTFKISYIYPYNLRFINNIKENAHSSPLWDTEGSTYNSEKSLKKWIAKGWWRIKN